MSDQAKPTSWIRLSDFAQVTYLISVTNNTTQIMVSRTAKVELTEVGNQEFTLKLPTKACAVGHFLSIRIRNSQKLPWKVTEGDSLKDADAFSEIEFTAKVRDEQPLDSEYKSVSLTLFQFDLEAWNRLIASIVARQQQINQVVRNIRE